MSPRECGARGAVTLTVSVDSERFSFRIIAGLSFYYLLSRKYLRDSISMGIYK